MKKYLKREVWSLKPFAAAAVILLALASSGCGYSLLGRGSFLPTYIKTIGVPMFTNRSNFFNFENQLTEKVRTEFVSRGKYTIVPEASNVDAVLIGEILSARLDPVGVIGGQPQAGAPAPNLNIQSSRSVTVTARVSLRDVREDKPIWENQALTFREEFPVATATNDPNAFFGQDVNALERITTDFARSIVSSILEAF